MQRGEYLFNEAALQGVDESEVLIVEGILDALPYFPNACACMGKPTEPQLRKMCAATRPLVLALDGDAWREGMAVVTRLQAEGKQDVRWLQLPPCEDPNSWKINLDRV